LRRLDRAGAALALLLPLFLLHGRGIAEGIIVLTDALFLARSLLARDWAWLRRLPIRVALLWWAWLVLCSARWGGGQLVQAVLIVRFPLLVTALENWALRDASVRRWLAGLVRVAFLYIALHSAVQLATGRNLFGWPRGADGELTGPYENPRAGPVLSRLFFPALLPPVSRLFVGAGWQPLWGTLILLGGVALMVLTGQRIPFLLTILGLFVTALLMKRLRGPVIMALVGAGLLLAASRVLSPPAFHRQVEKFSYQMEHFPESAYGQIAARALAIGEAHPLMGRGFDGFRDACRDPAYFRGWGGGDGGGAAMCVQHPHNHYLQAFVEAGLPGLVLFTALIAAWLTALVQGLWRDPDPLRVALFVAALVHEWPLASSSSFEAMPLSGWFFLLLGLGLAETLAYIGVPQASETARV
jgi:O-antigen ligase